MPQPLNYLKETPSQTAGPYVHIGLAPPRRIRIYDTGLGFDPMPDDVPGPRIRVTGCVFDGMGATVRDVLIEVWQADAAGLYPDQPGAAAGFRHWARVVPDFDTGQFTLDTVLPGAGARGRRAACRRRTCRCGWSRGASTPDCRRGCISPIWTTPPTRCCP